MYMYMCIYQDIIYVHIYIYIYIYHMYHAISIMLWAFASLMRMPYVYFCTSKASKLRVPAYQDISYVYFCTSKASKLRVPAYQTRRTYRLRSGRGHRCWGCRGSGCSLLVKQVKQGNWVPDPQDISITLWAWASMLRMPGQRVVSLLAHRAEHVAGAYFCASKASTFVLVKQVKTVPAACAVGRST